MKWKAEKFSRHSCHRYLPRVLDISSENTFGTGAKIFESVIFQAYELFFFFSKQNAHLPKVPFYSLIFFRLMLFQVKRCSLCNSMKTDV